MIDRKIGKFLERFPGLRRRLKRLYLRGCYALQPKAQSLACSHPLRTFEGFFGYYDKSPWSDSGSFFASHAPSDTGAVSIVLHDLNHDEKRLVGETVAWNWQQGAMLRWLPDDQGLIFNVLSDDRLKARIFWTDTERVQDCAMPIQTVHPRLPEALSLNYKRLFRMRAEYGYAVPATNFSGEQNLDQDGIWWFNLLEGNPRLIISIEQLANLNVRNEMNRAQHKVNHVMYSPSGKRFVFLHRWFGAEGKFSRLYVADHPDGHNLRLLMDDRMVSHYSWRDDDHLIVYGRTSSQGDRYYLLNVVSGKWIIIGEDVLDRFGDGHPSYSPDRRWIVTDTYPDKVRMRHLLLFDTKTNELHRVGSFFAPWKFDEAERVDLHPRWSPDGTAISIDSAHEGERRTYIVDVKNLVGDGTHVPVAAASGGA